MNLLSALGLIGPNTKTGSIFEDLLPNFFALSYKKPKDYIALCWGKYKDNYPNESVGTNGKFFELCIATLLIREKILPLYVQAKVAFVPNVQYDFILYSKEVGPISMSLKTSLRERYKQADLEAIALKYVHRKSECYLFTLNEKESWNIKDKIKNGGVIGLNDSIYVLSEELDSLIDALGKRSFSLSPKVYVVESTIVLTGDKIDSVKKKYL